MENCRFQGLTEIWAFKEASNSTGIPILTIESTCDSKFQFLLQRINRTKIFADPKMEDYEIVDADFGTGLDLKEEVFRDVFPVIDVVSW